MSDPLSSFASSVNEKPNLGVGKAIALEVGVEPSPRFDGGARAWTTGIIIFCYYLPLRHPLNSIETVAGAWLAQFCIIGLPLAFGVTESFYAETYLSKFTPSQINWIGMLDYPNY